MHNPKNKKNRKHQPQPGQSQPNSQSVNFGETYQNIYARVKQKEDGYKVEEQLLEEATNFFESADALDCLASINYIMLSRNPDGEQLLESDMAPLRPLMHFLARTARLQLKKAN